MSPDQHSDEYLIRRAQEGFVNDFETLFDRYKKPILNFIYRLIGNRETAEEVTIEVFMNAYKHLASFDPTKKFTTWAYTIARNLAKNALRDKKYFRDLSLETQIAGDEEVLRLKDVIADPHARPDEVAQSDELTEQAQKVLEGLPPKYREVIALCSIQGLPYREAAGILGVSIATVSIRLNEAKELFMKALGIATSDLPERSEDHDK